MNDMTYEEAIALVANFTANASFDDEVYLPNHGDKQLKAALQIVLEMAWMYRDICK